MLLAALLLAQCCRGAENSSAISQNGRFKVEAVTVARGHGPYAFRYRWFERAPSGAYAQTSECEIRYDSTDHFRMRLFVSPTGNGFLVESSISDPKIVFHAPSGKKLYSVDKSLAVHWDSQDGAYLRLVEANPPPSGYTDVVGSLFFLPLGSAKADWLTPPKPADLGAHVSRLEDDDLAVREKAAAALRDLGLAAEEPLEREMARSRSAEARARMAAILADLRNAHSKGHSHPHRNLLLLAGAISHPDAPLASAARERLRAILPKDAKLEASWIDAHVDLLRWDEAAQTYR